MKIRLHICSILLILCASPAFSAPGSVFYVDKQHPSASDANPGTEELPWKTIQHAVTVLKPGETVQVKEGVYSELSSESSVDSNVGIIVRVNGTADQRITVRNYPGHRPIIDQGGNSRSVGFINRAGYMNYVTISGFEIRNAGAAGVFFFWSSVKGAIVENNHIHHINGVSGSNVNGVKVWGAQEPIIRNNTIHNIAVAGNQTNQNATCIGTYEGYRMRVENNELYNCNAGVFLKRPTPRLDTTGFVTGNLIHDVVFGVRLSEAEGGGNPHVNEVITGNVMFNIGQLGVFGDAGETTSPNRNLVISNNTIVSRKDGIGLKRYENVEVFDNILYVPGVAIAEYTNSNRTNDVSFSYVDHNLYGSAEKFRLGVYSSQERTFSSLSSWRDATGLDVKSMAEDPLFVDGTRTDFRLRAGSPALSAGRYGGDIGALSGDSTIPGPLNRPSAPTVVSVN